MTTIVVASDFHFPNCGYKTLDALADSVFLENPGFLVLNGDVLDGRDYASEVRAFKGWFRAVQPYAQHSVLVMGNHDAAHNRAKALMAADMGLEVVDRYNVGPFEFQHGDLHENFFTRDLDQRARQGQVLVVGHAHKPQMWSEREGSAVISLPCMARQGVPGATRGFGIARCSVTKWSFETVVVTGS